MSGEGDTRPGADDQMAGAGSDSVASARAEGMDGDGPARHMEHREVSIGGGMSGSTIITGDGNTVVIGASSSGDGQPTAGGGSARPSLSSRQASWIIVGFVAGVFAAVLGNIIATYLQDRYRLASPERIAFVVVPFILFCGLGLLAALMQAQVDKRQAGIAPPPTLHMLRPPVADLTGREADIDELAGYLTDASSAAPVVMIRGMGGVGKTELALAVAERVDSSFPDAQLWFELQPGGKAATAEQLAASLVHALQPEVSLPDRQDELLRLCRSLLSGKRGLVLLDDVADAAQVQPLLPVQAGWATIITCRSRLVLHGAVLRDLSALTQAKARRFLRGLLATGGRKVSGDHVAELAELCDGLPLALRLAGEYLVCYDNEPADGYLARLRADRLHHLTHEYRSVAATLGASVSQLERKSRTLAWQWRQLAVFSAPFDLAASAKVWNLPLARAQEALDVMRRLALVEYHPRTALYSLHDLLHEYARQRSGLFRTIAADWLVVRLRHADHYLGLAVQAQNLLVKGGESAREGRRRFDALWPHLNSAWRWMRQSRDDLAYVWLRNLGLVDFLLYTQLSPDQVLVVKESELRAVRMLGLRHDESAVLSGLALVHQRLGEPRRAIERLEQALAIDRRSRDRRGHGALLSNLGQAYLVVGELRRALECYRQALCLSREIGDRQAEGRCLGNLATTYAALGEQQLATACYEQALAISRDTGDLAGECTNLTNLGGAIRTSGNPQRATELHEQALAIARDFADRVVEGTVLGNLGTAYLALGDHGKAIELYQQVLAMAREIGSPPSEATALGSLGLACSAMGDSDRAIEYFRLSLDLVRKIGDRRGVANREWTLGTEYEKAGQFGRAAELMQSRVDYEREIGHADAEQHAQHLEDVRHKAAEAAEGGAEGQTDEN